MKSFFSFFCKSRNVAMFLLFAGLFLAMSFFLSACASTEEDSTLPWAQPTGWENNKLPGVMPSYGDRRNY